MENSAKVMLFRREIDLIKDPKLQCFVTHCLINLPDYFFTMPASTTGKHHPQYSLGDGGLVRHTKAAIGIVEQLLQVDFISEKIPKKDLVYAALLLHDGVKKKSADSQYTAFEHPLLARDFILACKETFLQDEPASICFEDDVRAISEAV